MVIKRVIEHKPEKETLWTGAYEPLLTEAHFKNVAVHGDFGKPLAETSSYQLFSARK